MFVSVYFNKGKHQCHRTDKSFNHIDVLIDYCYIIIHVDCYTNGHSFSLLSEMISSVTTQRDDETFFSIKSISRLSERL